MSETTVAKGGTVSNPSQLSSIKRAATIGLLFGAFVIGGLWFLESGRLDNLLSRVTYFQIENLRIRTDWPLSASSVREWLPTLVGTNLLVLKPESLILHLKSKPWVENVTVKKEFPSGVFVEIETKRPYAITVFKGESYFLDVNGQFIERVSPALLSSLDLPFLTREKNSQSWNLAQFIPLLDKIKRALGKEFVVSQYVLGSYPHFKIYLASPKVEVIFSFEDWETQIQILLKLLNNPPRQIGQLQRINLVFPKKAVVSPSNSH